MDADNERHDYRRRDSFRDADFQPPRRMQSRYLGDFDEDRYNSRSRVRSRDDGFKDASPSQDRQSIVTFVQIPGPTSSPPLFSPTTTASCGSHEKKTSSTSKGFPSDLPTSNGSIPYGLASYGLSRHGIA